MRFINAMAAALALTATVPATAQGFPERPILLIIGASPGGTSDLRVRGYIPYLEKCLGQTVVPINRRPQNAAWAEAARATPDGYTITALSDPNLHISLARVPDLPFTLDSFVPLGNLYENYATLNVRADSEIQTINDLVAKLEAGEDVKLGISQLTSDDILLLLKLSKATGLDFKPIPLGGSAQTVTALLGGHVDAIVASVQNTLNHSEELRAIAVAASARSDALPDVPTFKESGVNISDSPLLSPLGAPAGLPEEVKAKLSSCIEGIATDPDFLAEAEELGTRPLIRYLGSDALATIFKNNLDEITELLKDAPTE